MQSKANNLRPFGSDGWILIPNETPDKTAPVFHHLRSNTCILIRLRRSVTSRNWIIKLDKIDEVETVRIYFLSDIFGLISSRNFATMATWRNDFSFLFINTTHGNNVNTRENVSLHNFLLFHFRRRLKNSKQMKPLGLRPWWSTLPRF